MPYDSTNFPAWFTPIYVNNKGLYLNPYANGEFILGWRWYESRVCHPNAELVIGSKNPSAESNYGIIREYTGSGPRKMGPAPVTIEALERNELIVVQIEGARSGGRPWGRMLRANQLREFHP